MLLSLLRDRPAVLVLGHTWPHHAHRSGYQPIADGVGGQLPRSLRLVPRPFERVLRRVSHDEAIAERVAVWASVYAARPRVLHVLLGDADHRLVAPRPPLSKVRLVATFHHPPDELETTIARVGLGSLDAAICVARCQLPLVSSIVPANRVYFLPHGVDTDYFRPSGAAHDPDLVLSVGSHRRDYETLARAATLIRTERPATVVRLIATPSDVSRIDPVLLQDVELMPNVSDDELRRQYRLAAALLLPLEETTANNSLLEAMACGVPVVTTDLLGVRDYIEEPDAILCPPGDAERLADSVLRILADRDLAERMSRGSRTRAEQVAWPKIRQQLLALYDELSS